MDAGSGLVCFFAYEGTCSGALLAPEGADDFTFGPFEPSAYCERHYADGLLRARWTDE